MWPNHRFRSMRLQQLTAWAQQYLCSLIGMASYSGNSTAAYMCSSSTAERNQVLGLHPSICHLLLSLGYKRRSWQKERLRWCLKGFWGACSRTHITGGIIDFRVPATVQSASESTRPRSVQAPQAIWAWAWVWASHPRPRYAAARPGFPVRWSCPSPINTKRKRTVM